MFRKTAFFPRLPRLRLSGPGLEKVFGARPNRAKRPSGFVFLCIALGVLLLFPGLGAAQQQPPSALSIEGFFIHTVPEAVYVDSGFKLENSAPVKAQLRDGAQMVLSCKIRVERLRTLLSNVTVSEMGAVFHLRHDPLLREFILFSDETKPSRQKNLDALLAFSWSSLRFALPLQEPLESGETYRVTVNVTLQHSRVPPWLEQALFFWSWDVVPPLTFAQEFTY